MAKLVTPIKAIRLKRFIGRFYRRRSPSPWHFQKPDKKNKTVCGIVIADHMGHKRRKLLDFRMRQIKRGKRPRWEVKDVAAIRGKKVFCAVCLGALIVE